MGADTFTNVAVAKTAEEAFRSLKESVAWEHGHGGYTGTIAEKGSFVMFELPRGFTLRRLEDTLFEYDDLMSEAEMHQWRTWSTAAERRKAESRARRSKAKAVKIEQRVPQIARMSETYEDKWGPAVCVELRGQAATNARRQQQRRGRVWAFLGYASC